ncbi:hypothetical protein C3K47_08635 [Solitalea longa]|uniref:DUF2490 domain-containing protein n=1 Tax=Solitalea longa TaxID=2079460 RepID=A0A2S5A4T4_9SPHI|nr:DUF2490 domain-containing protein [Solitalea longa]POY37113.1 hypothetical protein C3K47_08635 [Solitalea longa]
MKILVYFKRYLLVCLLLVLSSATLLAQNINTAWLTFNTRFQSAKTPWGGFIDIPLRTTDNYEHLQQIIIRPAISYKLNNHFTAAAGYAYVLNFSYKNEERLYSDEHRLWEQVIYNHKWGSVLFYHRLRNEHRWISSVVYPDDYKTQQRIRYSLRGMIWFNQDLLFEKGFYGVLQDEVMFNYVNKETTNNSFFDQNRLYTAIGFKFKRLIDLEGGYMNQQQKQKSGATSTNHIIQLTMFTKFTL